MTAEALVSELGMPAQPAAAPDARRHVRDVLSDWRVPAEQIHITELAVCELVSNAVRHATSGSPGTRVTLTLRHEVSKILAEVSDPDDRPPVPSSTSSHTAESGRGLLILQAVSQEWDYYLLPSGGRVVWCAIALP